MRGKSLWKKSCRVFQGLLVEGIFEMMVLKGESSDLNNFNLYYEINKLSTSLIKMNENFRAGARLIVSASLRPSDEKLRTFRGILLVMMRNPDEHSLCKNSGRITLVVGTYFG